MRARMNRVVKKIGKKDMKRSVKKELEVKKVEKQIDQDEQDQCGDHDRAQTQPLEDPLGPVAPRQMRAGQDRALDGIGGRTRPAARRRMLGCVSHTSLDICGPR